MHTKCLGNARRTKKKHPPFVEASGNLCRIRCVSTGPRRWTFFILLLVMIRSCGRDRISMRSPPLSGEVSGLLNADRVILCVYMRPPAGDSQHIHFREAGGRRPSLSQSSTLPAAWIRTGDL